MSDSTFSTTNWQDIIESHNGHSDNGRGLNNRDLLMPADRFVKRHIGPRSHDVTAMLHALGLPSLKALVDEAIPQSIRLDGHLNLEPPRS